jgi:hypothetical protein
MRRMPSSSCVAYGVLRGRERNLPPPSDPNRVFSLAALYSHPPRSAACAALPVQLP